MQVADVSQAAVPRQPFSRVEDLWTDLHPVRPERHMTSVLYIHVEDADRLAADWRAAGATVDGPRNEDCGKREGQHVDPDGNLIRFGSPIHR
jgi:uncharacterized glyoxalase superfamily protein PhnB